jgi:hypothetical protein
LPLPVGVHPQSTFLVRLHLGQRLGKDKSSELPPEVSEVAIDVVTTHVFHLNPSLQTNSV